MPKPLPSHFPKISNVWCPCREVCLDYAIAVEKLTGRPWLGISCAQCSYKGIQTILIGEDLLLHSPNLEFGVSQMAALEV